jgi:hypothetical protein
MTLQGRETLRKVVILIILLVGLGGVLALQEGPAYARICCSSCDALFAGCTGSCDDQLFAGGSLKMWANCYKSCQQQSANCNSTCNPSC